MSYTEALQRMTIEELTHLDAILRGADCPCYAPACLAKREAAR